MLLQQSSWQNNVRMSKLVEQVQATHLLTAHIDLMLKYPFQFILCIVFLAFRQISGPLSTIRTLSKMLSTHTKRSQVLVVNICGWKCYFP